MQEQYNNDPMLDMFIYETTQQIDQLERCVLSNENSSYYSSDTINEIFRIMHTIKSSAAMMLFNNISTTAHSVEDLFFFLRESKPTNMDCSILCDIVLEGIDFIKLELEKIKNGDKPDGDESTLIDKINSHLASLKNGNQAPSITQGRDGLQEKQQFYIGPSKAAKHTGKNSFRAVIGFQEGCGMENIRAFAIVHNLKDITDDLHHIPQDITDNSDSAEIIRKDGFIVYFKTDNTYEFMQDFFNKDCLLQSIELALIDSEEYNGANTNAVQYKENTKVPAVYESSNGMEGQPAAAQQRIISVSIQKLDKLMDLVGEMVISEAMVTQNPDLRGLELNNFYKAARQLKKITSELQDIVMSIRMVPLAPTFFKMNRIVRDMSKKLGKEVHLDIQGEDTEADKNVIERIADPLMHLVRNAVDHGIETMEERRAKCKPDAGTVTLEAKNSGSEVLIIVRDDGRGLDREKILQKAKGSGLLNKPEEEMTDREVFNLVLLPGFSTRDVVTEYSGRGVGMDVVVKNIDEVGGSIQIDSTPGQGTSITVKIPLTLVIIDGMNIKVGNSRYTIPTTSIKESFRPKDNDVFKDPDGNEMIMIRGHCYRVIRLHELYNVDTNVTNIHDGILIMVESQDGFACIFADELIGEQQVVVKPLPGYIRSIKKVKGLAGCTLLGDGGISLILDTNNLIE